MSAMKHSDASNRTPSANAPEKGAFYILKPDGRGGGPGHGVVFENRKDIPAAHPSFGPTLAALEIVPRLRYDPKEGTYPNDLDASFRGYWLVSEALKRVFESVDPTGFAFKPCIFTLPDGSPAAPHYFCEVLRVLDALDEEASTLKIETGDYINGKFYSTFAASLTFKREVVGDAHVFRTPYTDQVFCDRAMRDALLDAGFGLPRDTRGVWLYDAADTADLVNP